MAKTPRWNRILGIVGGVLLLGGLMLWLTWTPRSVPPSPVPSSSRAPSTEALAVATGSPSQPVPPGSEASPSAPPSPVLRLLPAHRTEVAGDALGAFAGRVVSATTGRGVPDAELTFAGPSGASSVRTGADGAFRFTPEQEGAWQLASVRAAGFLPFGPEWGQSPIRLTAHPRLGVDGLLLALTPEEAWTVRVEDTAGHPLAKAEVRLLTDRAGETVLFPVQDRFTTGEDGEVRVLAPEGSQVEARHAGHAPARAELGFRQVDRRVVLRLKATEAGAGEVLAGRVVDESGTGIAGALVQADSTRRVLPGQPSSPGADAAADEEGRFLLEGLEAGRYNVYASVPGRVPALVKDVATGRRDVVLTLARGARLTGRVRDESGQPVASFQLGVAKHVGPLEREAGGTSTVVDPEGRFTLEGLGPGRYTLEVAAHGLAPAGPEVEVGEGARDVGPVEVTLSRGARMEGRVVRAGTEQPVTRARVQVEGVGLYGGALATVYDALSDEAGRFVLEGLAPGRVGLSVSAEGYHTRIESAVQVTAGAPVFQRVELQPTEKGEAPQVELVGIGAVLGPRDDALLLGQLFPGGGAQEAGLREGDAIVRIDGTPVVDMGFPNAVQRIRGQEGSRLLLGVRRAGSTEVADVWVVRRKVKL